VPPELGAWVATFGIVLGMTVFDGRPIFDRERVPRPFATIVPVQPAEPDARTVGFLSPDQGFEFKLGWKHPTVEWKGVLLPKGGYDPTPLSQEKAVTFLRWFDVFLGRFARARLSATARRLAHPGSVQ
jgi:hypothetical protein